MKKLMLVVMVLSFASMASALDFPEGPDGLHGTADDTYYYVCTGTEAGSAVGQLEYIDAIPTPPNTLKSHTPIESFITGPAVVDIPAGVTVASTKMRIMGTLNVWGNLDFTAWSNDLTVGNYAAGTINAYDGTIVVGGMGTGGDQNTLLKFPNNTGSGPQQLNIVDCILTLNGMDFGSGTDADKVTFAAGGSGMILINKRTYTASSPQFRGTTCDPYNYAARFVAGAGEELVWDASDTDWLVIYSDVPEPATMLLLGLGGLLFRQKKLKNQA